MIDLHSHSTASDGTLTPTQLAEAAAAANLKALALTDHDTTAGLPEFLTAAEERGLQGIAGIELSCATTKMIKCHIVGLCIDYECQQLQLLLQRLRDWRQERNEEIRRKLSALGMALSDSDFVSAGAFRSIGRPHFARALVSRGYCRTSQEAFANYLNLGLPAYASRRTVSAAEGLHILRQAGGVTFWTHPFTRRRMTAPRCRRLVDELVTCGLDGLEAYYPLHTPYRIRSALAIAQEKGLLVSGGSDFHGVDMPDIALGVGRGQTALVPPELLPPIIAKANARR